MKGSIYIRCNKCGRQSKRPLMTIAHYVCYTCGANDFMMEISASKPSWWVGSDEQEVVK